MSDRVKSAYEIAMEKILKADKESGQGGPRTLTGEQKRAIAEIRSRSQARVAEAEILHRSNRAKVIEDAKALEQLEEEYQIDRRRIEDQREREIAAVRDASPKSPEPSPDAPPRGAGAGKKKKGKGRSGAAGLLAATLASWLMAGSSSPAAPAAGSATAPPAPAYLIHAARLFDAGEGQPLQRDMAVLVQGEKILRVGSAASVEAAAAALPGGVLSIELGDATLLPGLIDAHTHLLLQGDATRRDYDDQVLEESVAHRTVRGVAAARVALDHGFTTLRDLGTEGAGYADVALRDGILEGAIPGPRLYVATLALDISGAYPLLGYPLESPVPSGVQVVDGADAGRRAVREQVKFGADWIKVYCDRSYFVGKDGKLDSIPTFEPDELKAIVEEAHRQNRKVAAHAMAPKGIGRALDAGVDSIEHGIGLDDALVARMARQGVFYCPTLMVTQHVAPARAREGSQVWGKIPEFHRQAFAAALQGGVSIAFGTDAGGFPWTMNEAGEFAWMVRFGMTPAAALRAATTTAARLLGRDKEIGRIAEGYRADLVAVPGDPLRRIEAMEEVGFVMQAGRVVKNVTSAR
jgi:imidazolonepropionase-like amidohydrolase